MGQRGQTHTPTEANLSCELGTSTGTPSGPRTIPSLNASPLLSAELSERGQCWDHTNLVSVQAHSLPWASFPDPKPLFAAFGAPRARLRHHCRSAYPEPHEGSVAAAVGQAWKGPAGRVALGHGRVWGWSYRGRGRGGGSEDQMGRWGAEPQLEVAGRGRGWAGHTKHLLALLLGAD